MLRMIVPVPHQDVLSCRGLDECQNACKDLGICGALNRLIGFEVDSHNQYGSGFCFPQKGLVPATFNVKGFQPGQAMGGVIDDQDASMGAVIGAVGMRWVAKGMASVRSVWVESSLVLCDGAFNGDGPVDVAHLDHLVVTEILPKA